MGIAGMQIHGLDMGQLVEQNALHRLSVESTVDQNNETST
jgi:hypothetical protein